MKLRMATTLVAAAMAIAGPSAAANFLSNFSQFRVGVDKIDDIRHRLGPGDMAIRQLGGDREVLAFWYVRHGSSDGDVLIYKRSYIEHRTALPIPFVEEFYWHTLSDNVEVDFHFRPDGRLLRVACKIDRYDSVPDGLTGTTTVVLRTPLIATVC